MMMTGPQGHLLLPVRPRFVVISITLALLVQIVLLIAGGRSGVWLPDVLLMSVLYWALVQSRYIGVAWAFVLGLCTDMLHYGLLGQHALVYVVTVALALTFERRLKHFSALEQVPQIALVLMAGQLLLMVVGMLTGLTLPGWLALLKPVLEALLWPALVWVLQAPQRRAPDPDVHRPL